MNNRENKDRKNSKNENPSPKPDQETLHTADPQENMEGPVSSMMHETGDAFETGESKKEADEEKDKNM